MSDDETHKDAVADVRANVVDFTEFFAKWVDSVHKELDVSAGQYEGGEDDKDHRVCLLYKSLVLGKALERLTELIMDTYQDEELAGQALLSAAAQLALDFARAEDLNDRRN